MWTRLCILSWVEKNVIILVVSRNIVLQLVCRQDGNTILSGLLSSIYHMTPKKITSLFWFICEWHLSTKPFGVTWLENVYCCVKSQYGNTTNVTIILCYTSLWFTRFYYLEFVCTRITKNVITYVTIFWYSKPVLIFS